MLYFIDICPFMIEEQLQVKSFKSSKDLHSQWSENGEYVNLRQDSYIWSDSTIIIAWQGVACHFTVCGSMV